MTNFAKKSIEVCGLLFKSKDKYGTVSKVVVLGCYRSPSGNLDIFYNGILDILNFVYRPSRHIVFCGDFNLDSYRDNVDFRDFCDLLAGF